MSAQNETLKKECAKIIGIQFSILSPEEIRKGSVAEITNRDTYINNKPVVGGLFDPRMGVLEPGLICPTDGHDYMKTPGYFGTFLRCHFGRGPTRLHQTAGSLCLRNAIVLIDHCRFSGRKEKRRSEGSGEGGRKTPQTDEVRGSF